MKDKARDALEQSLKAEDLYVETARDELLVGNRRGLNMAHHFRDLDSDIAALTEKVKEMKEEITAHKHSIASLEDRLESLTKSLEAYRLLRNRFISTFKRDKLNTATEADKKLIAGGNAWAHGGDAVVDSMLYQTKERTDYAAYKRLYGLHRSTQEKGKRNGSF
jgi:hypothetical protein